MVSLDDNGCLCRNHARNRWSILFCGFYAGYPVGKNASGQYRQRDDSRTDSIYGGQTLWGEIDTLCERYGWTEHYVLWGVSYAKAKLMLADAINEDYSKDSKHNDDDEVLDLSTMDGRRKLNNFLGNDRSNRKNR